jgi:hypothetical protein
MLFWDICYRIADRRDELLIGHSLASTFKEWLNLQPSLGVLGKSRPSCRLPADDRLIRSRGAYGDSSFSKGGAY